MVDDSTMRSYTISVKRVDNLENQREKKCEDVET
ncbi:hypothetical protein DERF_016043 [Dermatophagoides farinae]|uniref:Uncharacterized protein n=1 Tax=Dermatophagoides farinae TaxID=6954 RepID=A0A922HL35_DERFA|nr:hypothetical protein DERF_016043 [Dermatophagoides farinae]